MDERSKKIQSFNVLVHKLPMNNFELLSRMSSFLIEIVENSQVNKMTVRNVGIVFAPTLNIPAPLIAFFLTDFKDIFGTPLDEATSPIHEIRRHAHQLSDDAIRSPRRQMFSDLPTPAYNETSFPQRFQPQPKGNPPPSFPPPPPPQSSQHHQQQQQQYQQQQYQQQQYQQQQQQQQQQQYQSKHPNYESGFIPIKPTYDGSQYDPAYQGGEGYGSLNSSVSSNNSRDQRQRRRESGMMLMNMGMGAPRQGSSGSSGSSHRYHTDPRVNNPLMVREETAFE
jgi:RalA-binding protein 1